MGSGKHLSRDDRYRIYTHCVLRGKDANWIHENLFVDDSALCSLEHLRLLVRKLLRWYHLGSHRDIVHYIVGNGSKRGGRPRRMSPEDDILLEHIIVT